MLSNSQISTLSSEFVAKSWVNPFLGFNRGYRLEPSNSRPQRRGCRIFDISMLLPSAQDSSVYIMPINSVSWIGDTTPLKKWISLIDYCNQTGTLITVTNPATGEILYPGDCYLLLVNGVSPVLITPFIANSVDVDIRTSSDPHRFSIETFTTVTPEPSNEGIGPVVSTGVIIADGKYYASPTMDGIGQVEKGFKIKNPGFAYLVQARISKLDSYQYKGDSFLIIPCGTPHRDYHHYLDMTLHVSSNVDKFGVVFDRTSTQGNIHQLTNSIIGVRSTYLENLCAIANIPMANAVLDIHICSSNRRYQSNSGMNALIENIDAIRPSQLLSNGDHRLDFVHASTLADNKYNSLQVTNIPNNKILPDHFDQWDIDNRLMSKRSDISDERLVKYQLSGQEFNKYKADIGYAVNGVHMSNYVMPRIYRYDHSDGVFGTDYYLSQEGVVTLLNGAYIVDHNGRFDLEVTGAYEIIDLGNIPALDHPDLVMEVSANDLFLHPGIDYTLLGRRLIVWKEGVDKYTISFYFSTYKRQKTGWIIDGRILIPEADVLGMGERINVFAGDEVLEPAKSIAAKNGIPLTIEYELLDVFNSDADLKAIKALRDNYDKHVATLEEYYTKTPEHDKIIGFKDFHYLVSPMCMDVLDAIRKGKIDPSPNNIFEKGVAKCVPDDIMAKYNAGYDPSTSSLMGGKEFTIIKAHDEPDLISISADEWNFLRHVNSVLLEGRITLELYYRISYE